MLWPVNGRSVVAAIAVVSVAVFGLPGVVSAESSTVPVDAPWVCGSGTGGAAVAPSVEKTSPDHDMWRYSKVWVPAGATVELVGSGVVQPRHWVGSWLVQEIFDMGLFEEGGAKAKSWSRFNSATLTENAAWTWGGWTQSWVNSGDSRTMLVGTKSELFLSISSESSVAVSVSGGARGADPGCVSESAKSGGELDSVGHAEDPVNTFTGSFTDSRVDLPAAAGVAGLDWGRSYDSGGTAGDPRWGFTFGDRLDSLPSGAVELTEESSRVVAFEPDGSGGFERPVEYKGRLSVEGAGWKIEFPDGSSNTFDASGDLSSREFWDGQTVTATRSGGDLTALTSSVGPSLTIGHVAGRLDKVTASDGREVSYGYDANGFLSTVTLPGAVVWTYENDPAGQVEKVIDPEGVEEVVNIYDGAGRVISQTGPWGEQTTFGYDMARSKVEVTDQTTSETVSYYYDGLGRLTGVEDPAGNTVERTYDDHDYLIGTTSRSGGGTDIERNDAGLVTEVDAPGADPVSVVYDSLKRVESASDANGTTTYGNDPSNAGERIPSTVTDPLGNVTLFEVNDTTLLVDWVEDADGVRTLFRYWPNRLLKESEDEYGNITKYSYDSQGRQTVVELPSGAKTTTGYHASGEVWTVTTDNGTADPADDATTTWTYDDAGNVDTVTDPTGAVTDYDYNPVTGLLSQVSEPGAANTVGGAVLPRVTTFEYWPGTYDIKRAIHPDTTDSEYFYGTLGRLTSEKDELDRETLYGHDVDGNVDEVTGPAGGVTETFYDTSGRVGWTEDASDRRTTYHYEPDTGLLDHLDTPAGQIDYDYDDLGRQTHATDLRGGTRETSYTPGGRVDWVEDPLDRRTDYSYDNAGRLHTVTQVGDLGTTADDLVTEYGYNADSLVDYIRSPEGNETNIVFDGVGRVLTETDPAGVVTTNTWTKRGELASTTKTGAGLVEFSYFPDGNVEWVEDALGHRTDFTYDNRGRPEKRIDPAGKEWVTDFNAAGELISETDPLLRATLYGYDDAGRLETVVDPSGRTQSRTWRADGLLESWSATDGTVTQVATLAYDPVGHRDSVTYDGAVWDYEYSPAGDLNAISAPAPFARSQRWTYDIAGQLETAQRVDGSIAEYAYDSAGRVESVSAAETMADSFTALGGYPDSQKWARSGTAGGDAQISQNRLVMYGPADPAVTTTMAAQVPAADNGDTTLQYSFDADTEPTRLSIDQRYQSDTEHYRLEITANSATAALLKTHAGVTTQLGTVAVPSSTGEHMARLSVEDDRIQAKIWATTQPEPSTWGVSVTDNDVTGPGVPRLHTAAVTATVNNVYVDDWAHADPDTTPKQIVGYSWDGDGNLSSEDPPGPDSRTWTWTDGQLASLQSDIDSTLQTTTLGYDTSGRLETQTIGSDVTTYTYDLASQIRTETTTGGTPQAWTYNNRGSVETHSVGANTTTYAYDEAAQLTSATPTTGPVTTYTHDSAGRRTAETTGTDTTTSAYDPSGNLLTATLPDGSTQQRLYDPDHTMWAMLNQTPTSIGYWFTDHQPNSATPTLSSIAHTDFTTYDNTNTNLTTLDATPWAAQQQGAEQTTLASDAQGSTITSPVTPTRARTDRYNAWDAPRSSPDSLEPTLGYRGELYTNDLLHLRARNYQPTTQQFTTTDPLPGIPGTPVLNNPYHYTNNNPLNLTDPTGLRPDDADLNDFDFFAAAAATALIDSPALGPADILAAALLVAGVVSLYVGTTGLADPPKLNLPDPKNITEPKPEPRKDPNPIPLPKPPATTTPCDAPLVMDDCNDEWERVGRWMSPDEFSKMVATSAVQVGGGNTTFVSRPPNSNVSRGATARGNYFVEFNVPSSMLFPGGPPGSAQIPGPGHRLAVLSASRGKPIPFPVPARNIVHVETKP